MLESKPKSARASRLALLALLPLAGVVASPGASAAKAANATAKVAATAKLDKKTGKTVVKGKVSGLAAGAQVSIYDAVNHILIQSTNTNAKSQFALNLPGSEVPCNVQIEAGDAKSLVAVGGADKSCTAKPACAIALPNKTIKPGDTVTFTLTTGKNKKATAQYSWDCGDGSPLASGASVTHTYKNAGLYRVLLTGSNGSEACADDTLISVAPLGTNPYGKVKESDAPAKASGMPTASGGNDKNAYVVFPFEDTGMQGGSQITLPFASLNPYNALNSQVIKKIPQKPEIVDNSQLDLYYSAASNPNDPVGGDSINSTSQNLFSGGKTGVNFDPKTTTCYRSCQPTYNADGTVKDPGKETKLIDGQDYTDAVIAKSEFWDRSFQPWDKKTGAANPTQRGMSGFDQQNAITLNGMVSMILPDQGLRGHVDGGKKPRAMPGISDPYKANVPQALDYSADQQSFVAQNIPISDVDDQGRINPYPVMRVEAKVGGQRVAATDVVYTAASETRCRECHVKGGVAADSEVWRTPVHESEIVNADGTPGPATGEGSYLRSKTPAKITSTGDKIKDFKIYSWGAAVHNPFNDQHIEFNMFGGTKTLTSRPPSVGDDKDANGVRKDRVLESRWLKPDGSTSPTNPGNDASWKLQVRLKFKEAKDYGDDSWQNQEKAALFNTALLHDYMTKYYGQYSIGTEKSNFGTGFATSFAEQAEEKGTGALGAACAGHHNSQIKVDVGASGNAYAGSLSQYYQTMHAFHGKMQVYKEDVSSGADKKAHKKGELIRDERGHPLMYGGRGWDSMHNDDFNVRQKAAGTVLVDANNPAGVPADPSKADPRNQWDTAKNNWAPDVFPMHPKGELLYAFGDDVAMEENCAKCHTGKTEKSYRDVHHAAGLKCDNCHGDMLAVGNGYPDEKYDYNLTAGGAFGTDKATELTGVDFRRPWIDEPDCGSCHVGDANIAKDGDHGMKHVFSPGALSQGWKDGASGNTRNANGFVEGNAKASMFPMDARFAVMPHKEDRPEKATATQADVDKGLAAKVGDTIYTRKPLSQALYRKSGDVHGSGTNGVLNCSTCHGSSHALWPNKDPNANDNVTAKQLQGYDGNIMECSTCHIKDDFVTGMVATDGGASGLGVAQGVRDGKVVSPVNSVKAYLAGPHGMHPVNDESWYVDAKGALPGGWHSDMTAKAGPDGENQCAACHGKDHKGTRLSKTLVDREFKYGKKVIKVAAGTQIGCDLCHKELYLDRAPTGEPKMHMPPKPESITGVTGGGSHH